MNEAELLFTEILNCDRLSLYLNRSLPLDKDKCSFISSVLRRRVLEEPIQHILGNTEFMGLEFRITPDVFIPRPETEILVETAINIVKLLNCHIVKLLDIGTGSGNIAISLAKFLPNARVTAIDISEKALKIAEENALLNNVKINFLQADLFDTYNLIPNTYDLILSNPPYIASLEIDSLQPEIKYEPRIALDGGKDGLDFYRCIIQDAPAYLKKGGFLIMEMGFDQYSSIKEIFNFIPPSHLPAGRQGRPPRYSGVDECEEKAARRDVFKWTSYSCRRDKGTAGTPVGLFSIGKFEIIEVIKDYNNIDRVVVARNG